MKPYPAPDFHICAFRYNTADAADRIRLNRFVNRQFGEKDPQKDLHPAEMNAMSFCAVAGREIVGYAGIVSWHITIDRETLKMGGLSCVCVHSRYRRLGLGRAAVKAATEWMTAESAFDIGLFTCHPSLSAFYGSIGDWEKAPGIRLTESGRTGAYDSRELRLDVFRLLISEKAKSLSRELENTTIVLNFPKGQFI